MPDATFGAKVFASMVHGIIGPCIGEAFSPYSYQALQKNLEELKTKLKNVKEMVEQLEHKDNGSAILIKVAIQWKDDAKQTLSNVETKERCLKKSTEADCMGGCFPNCRGRRAAKRSIQGEIDKVEDLITKYTKVVTLPVVKGNRLSENDFIEVTRAGDVQKIWECISQRHEVKVVCIHGIPGVGKTAVVECVYNKALCDEHEIFSYVVFVIADYGITLRTLQEKIMRNLSIDLVHIDDDHDRARKIHDEFVRRKKCLVVIDFFWEEFSLWDIGIPSEEDVVCKVIITSRSRHTCCKISKSEYFEIKPLTESWECYKRYLGPTFTDTEGEAGDLVKKAVESCDGLPAAIIELAHNVRGMHGQSLREITSALKETLSSRTIPSLLSTDMKLKTLEYSYNSLDNDAHQLCFLYCALYPKGLPIKVGQLIDNWIWEGLLDYYIGSVEDKREQGRNVLTVLNMARLLEKIDSHGTEEAVKMLNLLHDMAVNIIRKQGLGMFINSGNCLREFPPIDDQNGNIRRASFMNNKVGGILKNQPNCPNLTTLLLQNNQFNQFSDDFFTRIPNLKLLDLSATDIFSLPSSICDLKALQVLRLCNCHNLSSLPHLSNLEKLIVLNLYKTPLKQLPLGMERLKNLKHLDLSYTKLTKFQAGLFGQLESLQELLFLMNDDNAYRLRSKQSRSNTREAYVEELSCLDELRVLQLNFFNEVEFYKYMKAVPNTTMSHSRARALRFKFCVGGLIKKNENLGENSLTFIDEYPLSNKLPHGPSPLELYLNGCRCNLSPISTLEKTSIDFQKLKTLNLYDCSGLSYLFSLEMLRCLHNLETVCVRKCWSILGIIEPSVSSNTGSNTGSSCRLSKLKELVLINLPKLESIYPGKQKLEWPAFRRFSIWECDQLRRLPLIFNGKNPKVISLRGKSFMLDDYRCLEREEANVPEDVNSFVSTKKLEPPLHSRSGENTLSNYIIKKTSEASRNLSMLQSNGNEIVPSLNPGQIVGHFNRASIMLKALQREIGVLFYQR